MRTDTRDFGLRSSGKGSADRSTYSKQYQQNIAEVKFGGKVDGLKPHKGSILRKVYSVIAFLLMTVSAWATTLEWDRNAESFVTGYNVYRGTAPGTYTQVVNVGNAISTPVSGIGLTPGVTYYFAVKAYTSDGIESDFSNEVSWIAQNPKPLPPLRARIVGNAEVSVTVQATRDIPGQWVDIGTLVVPAAGQGAFRIKEEK